MSDYGFKTSDDNRATVLNAKNPIFGFDMQHTPERSRHFTSWTQRHRQSILVQ